MHDIEPFYNWEKYYQAQLDERSPFFGRYYADAYTHDIYGYYIHPLWDNIGSETLYLKVLFVDYEWRFAVIELFGEWNDALHNDIMHFKRTLIDKMVRKGINQFILIGENVFNFHGSDDCYYEEWFEDVEEGWITAINFRDFVLREWRKYNLDSYINFGGSLEEIEHWRTVKPRQLYDLVRAQIVKRLGE
ncbi:hypothetical protein [Eisenibacter elegans]|uniref:hypothetical protein n=1 Tax=Eisenibacter elegans TaxID=997 RepID=UPI000406C1B1|nr:hypothetical protein [Eisenibacter elegans]